MVNSQLAACQRLDIAGAVGLASGGRMQVIFSGAMSFARPGAILQPGVARIATTPRDAPTAKLL